MQRAKEDPLPPTRFLLYLLQERHEKQDMSSQQAKCETLAQENILRQELPVDCPLEKELTTEVKGPCQVRLPIAVQKRNRRKHLQSSNVRLRREAPGPTNGYPIGISGR